MLSQTIKGFTLTLIFLGTHFSSNAQLPFDKVQWVVGTWDRQNNTDGTRNYERWWKDTASSLRGYGITLKGTDTIFHERLRIITKDNALYYVADTPENKDEVLFKLTDATENKLVFENPNHDFPKKIEYTRNKDTMKAVVSGKGKSLEYLFSQTTPVELHPENPHYFLYKGQATVLITSAEHYGAVLNLDFDYLPYLDELKSDGLNLTRVFTGAYVEPQGAFNISRNTLAPNSNRFICPWARSTASGYAGGGNKFDLTKWDNAYFKRLKDFVSAAQQRGIVVELTLFCPFYEDLQWKISPMNAVNNVNGIGKVSRENVYTMDRNGGLLAIQETMTRKIVRELNSLDNVIFEICNEPYFGGVTIQWQHHIASLIKKTEEGLFLTHLISQNIANDSAVIVDPHPGVSVFNFHYANPPNAVRQNYHLNKVIGDNETGFRGQADETYRKEGWEIILAGGALYNNLDYSFAPSFEKGTFDYPENQPGGGSKALRQQLSYLKSFITSLDFPAMTPDNNFITAGLPPGARAHTLSQAGKQYAVYILHGKQVALTCKLPKGKYKAEWFDTLTGKYRNAQTLDHAGGSAIIKSPPYEFDIALRIVSTR